MIGYFMIKQEDVDDLLKTKAGRRKLSKFMVSPKITTVDYPAYKVFDWCFHD